MAKLTTNAPAAANTGRQRTTIHNRSGKTRATGKAVFHGPCGRERRSALNTARTTTANVPSLSSPRGGSSRDASPSPISKGATVTVPSRHDANQSRHTLNGETDGSDQLIAIAAQAAPIAAAAVLAARNPKTWRTSSSLN